MDLYRRIEEMLRADRERILRVIEALEQLRDAEITVPVPATGRRGRKSMSAEERQQVSSRMKKYWANRRRGAAAKLNRPRQDVASMAS